MNVAERERAKYEAVWKNDAYRNFSPGEFVLPLFRQMVRPKVKDTLVDIGAGTGRASRLLSNEGWKVTMLDFASNAKEVDLPFIDANIFETWTYSGRWSQGYCCDVLEHMPPEKIDTALANIFGACKRVFFSIHFGEDNFGKTIGHPLHLTIRPFAWWVEKLGEYGNVKNARDLLGMGVFDVTQ